MTDVFTILHLSDLHFSAKWNFKQNPIIQAFLKDVSSDETIGRRPNLIIFSGDIVNNPDEKDVYVHLIEFIDAIIKLTGLNERQLVLCPGNHDVSFAALKQHTLEYASIQRLREDASGIDREYANNSLGTYAWRVNRGFFAFCELLNNTWCNPFTDVRYDEDFNVSVVSMNTTTTCSLGGSGVDRGHLGFPISALEKAFSSVPSGSFVLSVGHHPLTDFSEASCKLATRLVESYSRLHFFGHLHDNRPQLTTSPTSDLMMLQAGPLYSDDKAVKSYQMIEVHMPTRSARVHIRTYKEARWEFDVGNEFAEEGIFPNDGPSVAFWRSHAPPIDTEKLSRWLKELCLPKLQEEIGLGFDNRPLDEMYVFPPLARRVDSGTEEPGNTEVLRNALAVLSDRQNKVIYVPEEFGATSLLSALSLEAARSSKKLPAPKIPLIIDVEHIKDYKASAERVLKQAHPVVDDPDFGWRKCLNDQPYLVLIDNFQPKNLQHLAAVRRVLEIVPMAQYIVAARTQLAIAGTALPIEIELPFAYEALTLRPFNRAKVRELVRKWVLPLTFTENYVVDAVFERFHSLSIPLSGPHICMFLTVICSQKSFSPINASTVIENFVEALLNKTGIEKIFRDGMDFRETADLLSYIAEHMVRSNAASLPKAAVLELIAKYYTTIGIKRNSDQVLDSLQNAHVFGGRIGDVSFRYSVLFSFFIAYRMKEDSHFCHYVFDVDRYTSFVHEIDLYCGLSRRDVNALDTVSRNYELAFERLDKQVKSLAAAENLAGLKLPDEDNLEDFTSEFAKAFGDRETVEGEKKHLDDQPVSPSQFRQTLSRKKIEEAVLIWIFALRAYSVCVKNLEVIEADRKQLHLNRVLDGWSRLAALAVTVLGIYLEGKEVEFVGYKIKLELSKKPDGNIVRMMLMYIPTYIAGFIRADLGTQKLSQQLLEAKVAENPAADLFRTGLLASMKAEGFLIW